MATLSTIKNWFRTGLKPTQAQFWATWDSFRHKDEAIPLTDVSGLVGNLDAKVDKIPGKGLSTEDYTLPEKQKLALLESLEILNEPDLISDSSTAVPTQSSVKAYVDNYSLPEKAVTNTKLADVPTNTMKGRIAAGSGVPKDLTVTEVRNLLQVVRSDFNEMSPTSFKFIENKPNQINFNIYNQNKTNKIVLSTTTKTSVVSSTTGSKTVPSYNLNDSFIGKVYGSFDNSGTARTIQVFFSIGNREGSVSVLSDSTGVVPVSIDYKIDFPTARLSSITGVISIGNVSKVIDLDFAIITGLDFDIKSTLNGGSLTVNSSYMHRNFN